MQRTRRDARAPHTTFAPEHLEPRVLLAAWTQEDIAERLLAARSAPFGAPDGVEVAGFGSAIAVLGDVNGDGIDDYAVTAPGTHSIPGFVAVYSGAGGASPLWSATGTSGGFGVALARIADLDGDGADDLIIGAPGVGDSPGRVEVRSGSTGLVILTVAGGSLGALAGAGFGASVVGTSDTNDDGLPDLLVGAPFDGATGAGRVYLLSGSDGSPIRTFDGEQPGEHFGWAVAAGPGVEGVELAIGAPGYDGDAGSDAGRILRITPEGAPIHAGYGSTPGGLFGFALHAFSVFGPEAFHLAVGAPLDDVVVNGVRLVRAAGTVTVFDWEGVPFTTFAGKESDGLFGYAIAHVDRSNVFEGHPLLAIGSPGANGGLVSVFTLLADELIVPRMNIGLAHAVRASDRPNFGASVAFARLTGHEFSDLLVGDGTPRFPGADVPAETGGTVEAILRVDPSLEILINGLSRNLEWIAFRRPSVDALFLFGPGGLTRYPAPSQTPVEFFRIVEVGDDGAVLASAWVFPDGNRTEAAFLTLGGDWINVGETVAHFVGAPDGMIFTPDMRALGLTPDGGVIVGRLDEATAHTPAGHSVWRIHGDTAEYLWTGTFVAASEAGILGRRYDSLDIGTGEPFYTTALWRPGTGVELIPDLQTPGGITADGRIVGVLFDTREVAVRSLYGVVTPLFTVDAEHPVTIRPVDIDGDGRVLWIRTRLTSPHFQPHPYSWSEGDLRLFDPALGFNGVLEEHVLGGPDHGMLPGLISTVNRLTPDGGFVVGWGGWNLPGGLRHYSPGIDERILRVATFASPVVLSGPGSTWSAFVNELGGITILEQLPGDEWRAWTARNLPTREPIGGGVAWIGPLDGETHFFLQGAHVTSHRDRPDGVRYWATQTVSFYTTDNAVMIRPDGLVIVATRTEAGEVVIYGEITETVGSGSSLNRFDKLYESQLRPRGLPTPRLVGAIDAYATPWGGHNIIGIDEHGDAWAIWNSHEIDGWVITNLSEWIGDVPPFRAVTAFITAWNAFNITGLNDDGELFTLWWAPELGHGNWRTDFIGFAAERFSLDASIDSWHNTVEGSLNFVGVDESGATIVYTWSVANQTWRAEIVQSAGAEDPARGHAADPHGSGPHARTLAARTDDGAPVAFVRHADSDWLRLDLIEML